jgi:uncharacterized membrane protein
VLQFEDTVEPLPAFAPAFRAELEAFRAFAFWEKGVSEFAIVAWLAKSGKMQKDGHREESMRTPQFSAILLPRRSLSGKGFIAIMLAIGTVSFVTGLIFISMGAWPVTGFVGLDAMLIYLAFRLNYRAARLIEKIYLDERELRVTRVYPSGRTEGWSFNPYWVRFEFRRHDNAAGELSLTSHGRRLVFGAFLSDGEKEDFAAALGRALANQRLTPRYI